MTGARFLVGDVFDRMAEIPDGSVDLVLTSPPFLALRSYLPAGHPDKAKEIGSEATPAAFIDVLLDLTEEWARVLTPHGSLCVELGDTYSGAGGYGSPDSPNPAYGKSAHNERFVGRTAKRFKKKDDGWPLAKSLCLIPELYRVALVYGLNPLTGRTTPLWRARNVVRWCRPNPPVGALGDKFRPGTSEMVVACKSASRWFDLDAVREPSNPGTHPRTAVGVEQRANDCKASPDGNRSTLAIQHAGTTAPPLDWWQISAQPYRGAHYATFPEALCVRPIKAMCPERVCVTCGAPASRVATDAGWTDCGHGAWRPGVVLDPFCGSGTTLAVAVGHGRDAIGIDLDSRNAGLAAERVGLFLEVDDPGWVA